MEQFMKQALFETNANDEEFDIMCDEFLNSCYVDEASFKTIDLEIQYLDDQLLELDGKIVNNLVEQESSQADTQLALDNAKHNLKLLQTQIDSIKQKSGTSNVTINKITNDISILDATRKTHEECSRLLDQLHLYVSGALTLRKVTADKNYSEATQVLMGLEDVANIFFKFESNETIRMISEIIRSEKESLKDIIKRELEDHFVHTSETGPSQGERGSNIKAIWRLSEALGPAVKQTLFDWYVKYRLTDYGALFSDQSSFNSLVSIDKRFGWFKKVLAVIEKEDVKIVFPADYDASLYLTQYFCELIKRDFKQLLNSNATKLDIKAYMEIFKQTVAFERFLEVKFGLTSIHHNNANQGNSPRLKFAGVISSSFEDHFDIYIHFQENNIKEMCSQFVKDHIEEKEEWAKDKLHVKEMHTPKNFSTATDLCFFYKNVISQVVSLNLKSGYTKLESLFTFGLDRYCFNVLRDPLPGYNMIKTDESKNFKLGSSADIIYVCCTMNTAENMHHAIIKMRDLYTEKFLLKDVQDVNRVANLFTRVLQHYTEMIQITNKALLNHAKYYNNEVYASMVAKNWHTATAVNDVSDYVKKYDQFITTYVPLLRGSLSSYEHFKLFCSELINAFLSRYIAGIFNSANVSRLAAEQMLLDTKHFTRTLSMLISLGPTSSSPSKNSESIDNEYNSNNTNFKKSVQRGMSNIEMYLKIVMTPIEPIESYLDGYMAYIPEADQQNSKIFLTLLDMKGVNRNLRARALAIYGERLNIARASR